jgi:hypothetical protein
VRRGQAAGIRQPKSCGTYDIRAFRGDNAALRQQQACIMSQTPAPSAVEFARLRDANAQMRETIRLLEEERRVLIARRFRRLLFFGVGISLVLHICLMIYLNMLQRGGMPGSGGGQSNTYTVAIISEEELTHDEEIAFDELPAGPAESDQAASNDLALDSASPDVGVASASADSIPTLGATGTGSGGIPGVGDGSSGAGLGLGGGGGSASFFGTGGKGQRFAYIVDISGSMGDGRKFEIAMRELVRSIDALPDFAHFHVILFESKTLQPPMQTGWIRARKSIVRQVIRWLGTIEPNGGTEPRTGFLQVFDLDVRPDVLFFLTDGIFNDISLEEINALNSRGRKVVMNVIGFGAPGEVDQSVLRSLASQSGGQYRFVSTEMAP